MPARVELGGPLDAAPPPVSTEQAEALAGNQFGLTVSATALSGERDRLFRLDGEDGAAWLLRVIHPDEDATTTATHTAVLDHLAAQAPELPTPRVLPPRESASAHLRLDDGRRAALRVTTFTDGTVLASLPQPPPQLPERLGAVLGDVDAALADFPQPPPTDLAWNLSAFLRDASRHETLIAPHADLAAALEPVVDRVVPALKALPHQVIHNDLNPHNVVLDEDGAIAAVIDFGDLAWAPRVQDVAVAMSYLVGPGNDLRPALMFLRGYVKALPLQEYELELLNDLIVGRAVMAMAITRHRARRHPDNADYILRNHAAAELTVKALTSIRQLDWLDRMYAAITTDPNTQEQR